MSEIKRAQSADSHLMLAEQEGQKHQHASVMDDPPHIYVAFSEALSIGRITGDILRNQQGQTSYGCLSNGLCKQKEEKDNKRFVQSFTN